MQPWHQKQNQPDEESSRTQHQENLSASSSRERHSHDERWATKADQKASDAFQATTDCDQATLNDCSSQGFQIQRGETTACQQ